MPDKRVTFEDEISSNRYTANMMLVIGAILVSSMFLNMLGVYNINKVIMNIAVMASVFMIAVIQVLARVRKISSKKCVKYIIMAQIIVISMVCLILFNFSIILITVLPLVLAMGYHSKKLVLFAGIGSLINCLVSPIFGYVVGTWDISYFIFLVQVTDTAPFNVLKDNEYVRELLKTVIDTEGSKHRSIMTFVSMPMVGMIVFYMIVIFNSVKQKQKNYNYQIKHLNKAQDKTILGLADVIENRDMNTGGHVKRTSDVVRIFIDELQKQGTFADVLDHKYCQYIIKSAPMHDVGKIAVEDAILTKPSKLTPEEFEKIKIHPEKSKDIIEGVMGSIADQELVGIAKNLALYHHEHWDGSGYPAGLSGEDIPLEARIMALADVYDALVSERCYKDSVSSEEAYKIIKESMGSHFDPKLWDCFDRAYPRLKDYYNK